MLTNNDIANAIAALVEKAFPGEKLYRDFVPDRFERPCNLLELVGGKYFPNFSCGAVEIRPTFALTTYVEVNPYHQQNTDELTRRQMILMGLFLPGYVKVKDRAPHVVDEGEMGNGLDLAAITVTLSYILDRSEFMELQQAEDMAVLHIRQEVTTHG